MEYVLLAAIVVFAVVSISGRPFSINIIHTVVYPDEELKQKEDDAKPKDSDIAQSIIAGFNEIYNEGGISKNDNT